jgi:hypothetical protein
MTMETKNKPSDRALQKAFFAVFRRRFLRDFAKAIEKLSRARFTYAANESILW